MGANIRLLIVFALTPLENVEYIYEFAQKRLGMQIHCVPSHSRTYLKSKSCQRTKPLVKKLQLVVSISSELNPSHANVDLCRQYYSADGLPKRKLEPGVCAVCNNRIEAADGNQAVVERTFQLGCDHMYPCHSNAPFCSEFVSPCQYGD